MLAPVASMTIDLNSDHSENVQLPACPALMSPVACLNKDPDSDYSENVLSPALCGSVGPIGEFGRRSQSRLR